ncbi:ThiF family adenylyltransferase [Pseudobdellovibrio sp. HCB154]|uniref:tRNA threonylcarbamoyladenosine dehydratase n=1 Tax=Pseudobdellovibrio sp. HCB154 TaxID=3386277 RepID=UPI0039175250
MEIQPTKPFEIQETNYVLHRRFDRMGRLVGDQNMKTLFNTHVMILGLGGVGSWAAESLARSGVGKITLIDHDEICITNANRQLHALQGMVGKKKAEIMAERLRKINPQAEVIAKPVFYNKDTSAEILSAKPDYILDCIDNITAKTFLLNECRTQNLKVITSCGASAKMDPTRVKIADLAKTEVDPLAHSLRKILRQEYNFPRGRGAFGIPCVYSDELPMPSIELNYDNGQGFKCVCPQGEYDPHSCLHRSVIYGTASFVTGAFGLVMASWVVRDVMTQNQVLAAAATAPTSDVVN